ncbi:rubrerythrin family protein [Corynebacterium sp. 320]|uniref:VIT1/CCC1 transporter family protein n=1 Tax=Corynebacterium TaxID=1716 RepID=UPI00125CBD78|nr:MULTISPECIES: VIT1/CCC1 transporter family protein [Corynebacterium]KAB1502421.1 rubrerythrin family protein [Corynebacterium sp. 320]KAB1551358.1 rubrerythrin family protein [Corynebacterium sp. 321]KAB1551813.1 rubrerythrin family protein [Corynebacterium sp. 319]KAB3526028.1 rubrerythrin family protein [Corynebacterium sp. 250]KAB3538808.1 rubrerythrin family protein [Corynebacterium sp. 366]
MSKEKSRESAQNPAEAPQPSRKQINRWRQYLANERAEGAVYRELARKKQGEEREILLGIAEAEERHEEYWRQRLGDHVGLPRSASWSTRMMAWMARRFGTVFVLAMMQSAESRNGYLKDEDATEQMAADEAIHAEVIRGLAARGRAQMSGDFRAAIFGANDGLVSNTALVLGMVGTGASSQVALVTGLAGLLAGALSMAAGEYISVSSQHELMKASSPSPTAGKSVMELDVQENELELVYRARGMNAAEARRKALEVFDALEAGEGEDPQASFEMGMTRSEEEQGGSPISAAISSFFLFSLGALIPVVPYILGLTGSTAAVAACVLVGIALMVTGGIVGVLSGTSPMRRALRQLAIGFGAAAVTYLLGSLFDVSVS